MSFALRAASRPAAPASVQQQAAPGEMEAMRQMLLKQQMELEALKAAK